MPRAAKSSRSRTVVTKKTVSRSSGASQKRRSPVRELALPVRKTQSLRQQNVIAGLDTIELSATAIHDALKGLRMYVQELEADLETTRRAASESYTTLREEMEEQLSGLEAQLDAERQNGQEAIERARLEGERYAAQLRTEMEKEQATISSRLERTTVELENWKERCKKLESRLDLARNYIEKPLASGARVAS